MVRKRGKQAKYIPYKINGVDEVEVKELVNGYEMGVLYSERHKSHYTMIPKALAGEGVKRSKQKWLKGDRANAIAKFYALVAELRGDNSTTIATIPNDDVMKLGKLVPKTKPVRTIADFRHNLELYANDKAFEEIETGESLVVIPEAHHIEWLKRQLQDPKALAKKTGIEAFNNFREWMLKTNITLTEIYTNYTNSIRYSKIKDPSTKKKTKKAWDDFTELTNAVTVDAITLQDVKAFERMLHVQGLADKTISHYRNNVKKIFRYSSEKIYVGNADIQQVLSYFSSWEDLDINSSDTIAAKAISKKDFTTLYNAADAKGDLQMKAVLMLCLNTGTYLREVARFKISDIDLEEQTLMTQRNKTGRCKKFAYLWTRTVNDLNAYLATRKDSSDILFIASHGSEYKDGGGIRTRFWKLRDDTDLGAKALGDNAVEFNHLRDAFQTLADEQGVTAFHSNMVMGHSTGRTKERYSHRRIHNELKVACEKVEKAFFGSISIAPEKKNTAKKSQAK